MRDAAIHRVLENADGQFGSVTGSQWIATDYALALTRVGGFVVRRRTVRAYISLFTLQSSHFRLLAFLETNTKA